MFIMLVFLLGLFMGSFLLVIIDRFGTKKSFITGRSECEYCHEELAWYDLVPVLSFLSTGGKCRYCHKPLSVSYPLFEVLTGGLFALTSGIVSSQLNVGSSMYVPLALALALVSCLLLLFFIDLKYGILPFSIVFPAIFITILYQLLTPNYSPLTSLLTGIGAFVFFLFLFFMTIAITKKEGMGFGDVVYAFFMGLLLGWPNIITGMYIAFLSGAVLSLVLIALKKKKFQGSTIPFGPFLVIGTYIAWLWGSQITSLVLQWLLHM